MATNQSKSIITYVVNHDENALKDMFCKYISKKHDLDNELTDFFNYIHGDIISYDEPIGQRGFKSSTPDGIEVLEFKGSISNIKTDAGKTYRISFNSYHTYTENEDYVGISFIVIQEIDTYDTDLVSLDKGVLVGEVLKD